MHGGPTFVIISFPFLLLLRVLGPKSKSSHPRNRWDIYSLKLLLPRYLATRRRRRGCPSFPSWSEFMTGYRVIICLPVVPQQCSPCDHMDTGLVTLLLPSNQLRLRSLFCYALSWLWSRGRGPPTTRSEWAEAQPHWEINSLKLCYWMVLLVGLLLSREIRRICCGISCIFTIMHINLFRI